MKYIQRFALLLAGGLVLAGCLKDDQQYDYSTLNGGILLPNSNWPSAFMPVQDSALPGPTVTRVWKLYARTTKDALPQELTVAFKKDPAVVSDYNNKWFATAPPMLKYQPLPDSCYDAGNLQLVLPGGAGEAFIPINIFPGKIQAGTRYMLAFSISDAGNEAIASNKKTIVFGIKKQ